MERVPVALFSTLSANAAYKNSDRQPEPPASTPRFGLRFVGADHFASVSSPAFGQPVPPFAVDTVQFSSMPAEMPPAFDTQSFSKRAGEWLFKPVNFLVVKPVLWLAQRFESGRESIRKAFMEMSKPKI